MLLVLLCEEVGNGGQLSGLRLLELGVVCVYEGACWMDVGYEFDVIFNRSLCLNCIRRSRKLSFKGVD